jgi:flavorubredoxin
METPMVHWPDSMFTYCAADRILFSMDAFGQHFASAARFDDQVDLSEIMQEAKKYYANILMLYGKQIKRVLKQAGKFDIDLIAPSHGIIWRQYVDRITGLYNRWVDLTAKPKVLVIFDTMWESTRIMAQALLRGVMEAGVEAKLIWVRASGLTEIATEVLDSAVVAVGSPTLNKGMMPMMGAVLTYLKGLEPAGKKVRLFSSTGWGKGAAEAMTDLLKDSKMEVIGEPLKVFWRPDKDELEKCVQEGHHLAQAARQIVREQGQ